ncbi:myosin light chain kinase, smooth muscle-like [Stegostoma tigrinum]|uniref:myosin light chain kinase, smooth muscle-like n=1 Tax=Stegostoma tigrinum TaxID=3053191 RepID=UPI00202B00DB|nr:myosin light chain kinase, smooth muscle-like [Stegostoma tigrinum]XP_048390281.1 myosin light chain kinase, smooth muscle-like [Stegostoma tigrinum]XP_059503257.1 myosin light chain kinase, smooth muscle-like [Stegostoma tigrinum]XP_059503258.1 myosin light chain kinase, smooth muscle-like [Stegostoma tigrinum]
MGDVKIAQNATRISKTTLTLERPQADTYPPEAPAFTLPPRNLRIPIGGTARFDGKVRGCPEPHVTWYKNGQLIPKNDRYVTEQSTRGTFSLVIKQVQKDDAGKYTCETANVAGVRQVTVELTIQEDTDRKYGWPSNTNASSRHSTPSVENRPSIWGESPPKFVTKPTRLIVKEGQSGKFCCKITGRPHPQVIWLKGDAELQQSDHFNMFEKSGIHFLEIRAAQADDAGNYVCLVMNNSGKAMASVELILQSACSTSEISSVQQRSDAAKTIEPLGTKQTTANNIQMEKEGASAVTIQSKENLKVVKHVVAAAEKPEAEDQLEKRIKENKSHPELKSEVKNVTLQQKILNATTHHESKVEMKKIPIQHKNQMITTTPTLQNFQITTASSTIQKSQTTPPAPTLQNSQITTASSILQKSQTTPPAPTLQKSQTTASSILQKSQTTPPAPTLQKSQTTASSILQKSQTTTPAPALQKSQTTASSILQKSQTISPASTLQKSQTTASSIQEKAQMFTRPPAQQKTQNIPTGQTQQKPPSIITNQKSKSTSTLHSHKVEEPAIIERNEDLARQMEESKEVTPQLLVEGCRTMQHPQTRDGKLQEESRKISEQKSMIRESPPDFLIYPESQTVLEGEKVTFRCKITGNPKPEVKWTKNGVLLKGTGGLEMYEKDGIQHLCISCVNMEDSGSYSCTVTNRRGQTSRNWTLSVTGSKEEEVPPFFTSVLKECRVSEGQDFVLQCSVDGKPQPRITWLVNDTPIQYAHSSFENDVAKLYIQDALPEDDAIYTCVAENKFGRTSCCAKVTVKEKKTTKKTETTSAEESKRTFAPVILKELNDLQVMDGSQVRMTVEVAGNPPPEIIWLHNGKEIQESEDFQFEKNGNEFSLFIQEVFPEDTGKYTCEAWNDFGEVQTQAILTVQEPQDGIQPWFISKPKAVTSTLGEHALISCAIAGDPFPTVQWLKDGKEVIIDEGCKVLQNEDVFTLFIKNIQLHHAGQYEIRLKNPVGKCSCHVSLLVKECSLSREEAKEDKEQWNTSALEEKEDSGDGIENFVKSDSAKKNIAETRGSTVEEKTFRGVLRRKVETKEQSAEQLKQHEAEQKDFRCVLGKKVITKSFSEEVLKEQSAEQMNFRDSLSRHVKTTNSFEEEKKISGPQQVDFRAVLGKKNTPKISQENITPKQVQSDIRSAVSSEKQDSTGKKANNDSENLQSVKVDLNDNGDCKNGCSCIDGGIIDQKPENTGNAPIFKETLKDTQVVDGERLLLQCRVAAEPAPVVTWTINGKAIKSSKFINISQEGSVCTLAIEEVLPEDEGLYKCIAENSAGKMECSCSVTVADAAASKTPKAAEKTSKTALSTLSPTSDCVEATIKKKPTPKTPPKPAIPPQILQCPGSMKVRAGESVEVLCKLTGTQPLSYTWLKFRKQIKESDHIKIENTDNSSKLIISSTKHDDCGCYNLFVENKIGSKQVQVNLTVVDRPEPPAGKPCSSDIRNSTLTLSWYGPTYDGGSVVQSYNVETWNSVEKQWTNLTTCRSTSCSVRDLNPDKEYKFRVRAVNVYGTSEPSQESDLVRLGVKEEHNKDEADLSDDDEKEGEPDYRDVNINTSEKVTEYYDILEKIGTGKFGQVFKLVEKKTRKVWAGKFFKAFSAKDKENVRQEISIMNCLHHPKLVQCVDAFESKSDIVMVLEIVSGGELFERIIDEDFELTERECIKYMLQINEGVQFIHKQGIVHLDLKPENIMCVNKTGARIKLIDFGLARRLESATSLKVLFGTPEFVAPEVINYEPIGYATDMWSIGVICYILVSGLSPFMGDNDNETLANVTSATWDFDDDAFDEISDDAKDFIDHLLKKDMKHRMNCDQCLEHKWLKKDVNNMAVKKLSKERMKKYMARRKWQKTGHAVRAIGRLSSMAMLAGLSGRKTSLGSVPTSPADSAEKPEAEADEAKMLLEAVSEERQCFKPYFSKTFKDTEVVEESAARFDCKIEGYPDPEVMWFKGEQPIKESRHYQIEYDEDGNCSLIISDVSAHDDGKYTCKAINNLGEATWTSELIVETMEESEMSNTESK